MRMLGVYHRMYIHVTGLLCSSLTVLVLPVVARVPVVGWCLQCGQFGRATCGTLLHACALSYCVRQRHGLSFYCELADVIVAVVRVGLWACACVRGLFVCCGVCGWVWVRYQLDVRSFVRSFGRLLPVATLTGRRS